MPGSESSSASSSAEFGFWSGLEVTLSLSFSGSCLCFVDRCERVRA